ncbi:hypothetical protein KPH14_013048, partial [Odynerus spinipes]
MATSDNNASTNDTQTQMVDMLQNIMKALNALNVSQNNQNRSQNAINRNTDVHPSEDESMDRDDVLTDDESSDSRRSRQGTRFLLEKLKFVPDFDGDNISVETFIFDLQVVLREIRIEEHNHFIRLVKVQKIRGKALRSLDGADLRSIDDLKHTLRLYFGENKTLDSARIDRSMCTQERDNVLSYNRRFLNAQLNVRRAVTNDSSTEAIHKKYTLADEEKHGLSQYIRGLNESLRISVRAHRPINLREAQNIALELEQEDIMARKTEQLKFRSQPRERSFMRTPVNRRTHAATSYAPRGMPSFRQYNPSPNLPPQQFIPPPNLPPQSRMRHDNPSGPRNGCYVCGGNDHYSRDCTKRQNFPSRREQNVPPIQFISQ